jgi:FkbM family methyltransferase
MENLLLNLEFVYGLKNSAWFKLKYLTEKALRKITLRLGRPTHYLFDQDYILKASDFSWKIKAHSDFDDIVRPIYERDMIPYFLCTGVFVDVGACIGKWSLLVSKTASHVYAFDPDPGVYGYLVENIKLNHISNITTFNKGLSSSNGTAKFFIEGSEHSGVSKITEDGEAEIETMTLDSLDIPEIELMKIDEY